MDYQRNWLCKNCSRPYRLHVKIGAPGEEGVHANLPANFNWCFSKGSKKYEKAPSSKWEPTDNLTQVELLAKQKGITD